MINDVKAAIDAILGNVATLRAANGAGRIFELFIMTGIASRLHGQGFDVWLQRSDGSRVGPADPDRRFIQRGGSPTGVLPAAFGRNNASVIGLRRLTSGSEWEMWNGIQFQGRSGATHEIDIAVVPRAVGMQLRQSGGRPFGRPRVSIECKDVGQSGSVDEMRTFVARLYDLTVLQGHQAYIPYSAPTQAIYPGTNAGSGFYAARTTYWDENRNTFNAVARRTGFVAGATAMTQYYAVEPHDSISAASPQAAALMDAVSQWIATACP
jgi:hypothetical protein